MKQLNYLRVLCIKDNFIKNYYYIERESCTTPLLFIYSLKYNLFTYIYKIINKL